jgi:Metal-sensitive transcriptional repressor
MHTIREKTKLLARVRRIRGQVEAIERAPYLPPQEGRNGALWRWRA